MQGISTRIVRYVDICALFEEPIKGGRVVGGARLVEPCFAAPILLVNGSTTCMIVHPLIQKRHGTSVKLDSFVDLLPDSCLTMARLYILETNAEQIGILFWSHRVQ